MVLNKKVSKCTRKGGSPSETGQQINYFKDNWESAIKISNYKSRENNILRLHGKYIECDILVKCIANANFNEFKNIKGIQFANYDFTETEINDLSEALLNKDLSHIDRLEFEESSNISFLLEKILTKMTSLNILKVAGCVDIRFKLKANEIKSISEKLPKSLKTLILNKCITDDSLKNLTDVSWYLNGLITLDLSNNNITVNGIKNLFNIEISEFSRPGRTTKLRVHNASVLHTNTYRLINKSRATQPVSFNLKNLHILDLSSNKLSKDGAIALSYVLLNMHELRYLDLSANKIENDGAVALAKSISKMSKLNSIIFSHNQIKKDGIIALAKASSHLINNKVFFRRISFTNNLNINEINDAYEKIRKIIPIITDSLNLTKENSHKYHYTAIDFENYY